MQLLRLQNNQVEISMVLSTAAKEVLKRVPKKNTRPLTGGGSSGRFNAPDSQLPEFEHIDTSTLPDFQRPLEADVGFHISDTAAERARQRNRWLEYETYRSIQRLKYQRHQGNYEQKKRRGYRTTGETVPRPAEKGKPKTPVVVVPDSPTATQPMPIPDPPITTPNEPDFDIPPDPPEDDTEDREEEFETCEDLEEKIRAFTGMAIQICPGGGVDESFRISGSLHSKHQNKANKVLRGKGRRSSRRHKGTF